MNSKGPNLRPRLPKETISMTDMEASDGLSIVGGKSLRKRGSVTSLLSSDTEFTEAGAPSAPKVSKANGRGRLTRSYTGLLRVKKVPKRPQCDDYEADNNQTDCSVSFIGEPHTEVSPEILQDKGDSLLDRLLNVAKVSRNQKGSFQKEIKEVCADIKMIIDALADRTKGNETLRFRSDYERLRRDNAMTKKENKALRAAFSERTSNSKDGSTASQPTVGMELVEAIKGAVLAAVGQMLDARFANIEDRLLPAKTVRPPLAADKQKAMQPPYTTPPTMSYARVATSNNVQARPMVSQSQRPVVSNNDWTLVTKKKTKKRNGLEDHTSSKHLKPAHLSAPTKVYNKTPKLNAPRSAAVVITLQPEAVSSGVTYAKVLGTAKQCINLAELGIDGLRSRKSATGAQILELPGTTSGPKADLLAEKLKTALASVARIDRPVKSADLHITGLDDSIEREDIIEAIAKIGECSIDRIKVGPIRPGPGGVGSVYAQCPVTAAKLLGKEGRILVGWSSARVLVLGTRRLRCYRCMEFGHARPGCPSKVDRSNLCFRCGKEGHKAAECEAEARCAVCSDAGCASGHVMGGSKCHPPSSKRVRLPHVPVCYTNITVEGNVTMSE